VDTGRLRGDAAMIHFILYSRSYCHLCDDLLQALQACREGHVFTVEVIDIDADDALVAQYDELVPVLAGRMPDGSMVQICHYFLDHEKLQAFFSDFMNVQPIN
jgi:Glutaredoxin-like domain (DUF836)